MSPSPFPYALPFATHSPSFDKRLEVIITYVELSREPAKNNAVRGGEHLNDQMPITTEKRCPRCGFETVAWISSDIIGKPAEGQVLTDKYECRKCNLVFIYRGVDD